MGAGGRLPLPAEVAAEAVELPEAAVEPPVEVVELPVEAVEPPGEVV